MTKINKSRIFVQAHTYRVANNLTMSAALKAAWLNAKIEILNVQIDTLRYADRFTAQERIENDTLRSTRNDMYSAYNAIIPPVKSEADIAWEAEQKAKEDAILDASMARLGNRETYAEKQARARVRAIELGFIAS